MRLGAVLVLLLCSAGIARTARGQSAPSLPPIVPPLQTPSLRTQSTVVVVPALVRNAKGELVFTLTADDFSVTDDGVAQPLRLDEDTGSEPLALVIAVETGGAGAGKLEEYRNLSAILDAVVGGVSHRIAVVAFDSEPRAALNFTAEADVAAATLGNLDEGDKGASILDAIKFSVDMLRMMPPNYRRAILLISETLDRTSQATLDDALRAISDTNTAIYSLGFSSGKADASHYAFRELPVRKTEGGGWQIGSNAHPGPPHGCMGKDPDPDATQNKAVQAFDCLGLLLPPLALAKMAAIRAADGLEQNVPETVANLTGGEYFKFEKRRGLVDGMLTISNHVPNRYVLSFQPSAPHAGFHAVELRLRDHPELTVTARNGYWADGQESVAPQP